MELPKAPPAEIVEEVKDLFCNPSLLRHGRYQLSEAPGETIIPGVLYRFTLLDADSHSYSLQLYKGIQTIGGALWTREVRTLHRVSTRQHPALPSILNGDYVEDRDLAYVITEAARYRLSDKGAMEYVAQNREQALRQFTLLAHGLSLLHEQGITHRNLHPGSIEYFELGPDAGRQGVSFGLRLSRFEMTAMVSNLIRRQLAGEQLGTGDLRSIYLDAADATLPYCPPERAAWLLGADGRADAFESDRSDIYSLGVIAWRWLVESYSVQERSYEQDHIAWSGLERSLASVQKLNAYLRARLNNPRIPSLLANLLSGMLAWEQRDRPHIFSVLSTLTRDYGRMVANLSPSPEQRVFHVGFMPDESKKTVYRWQWIDQDPMEPEGREHLRAFLETELRGAELLYHPEGFSAFERAQHEREFQAFQAAKYVLVGKQGCWFCDIYFEAGPAFSREDKRVEHLLLIKYVIHHRRARRLLETPLRRQIPGSLKFVPVWSRSALDLTEIRKGASWKPVVASVEIQRPTPEWMTVMDDALSFLLDFRSAELDARSFPFKVLQQSGFTCDLRFDETRDRRHQFDDALRSLYYRSMRVPMARLFESLEGDRTELLAVYADREGKPDYKAGVLDKVKFERRLGDDDTVRVRYPSGRGSLPAIGWIRPDQDQGSYSQLQRQEDAVQEMQRARSLLHQMHSPTAIKGISSRWRRVGAHLKGRGPEIIRDMLSTEPFYALHGPPGTGKTTETAVAVAAHLLVDRSQRVLISSQSHFALDNLARRVLKECEDQSVDHVAVRVASPHAVAGEKVHPEMEKYLPDAQASATVRRIQNECKKALATGDLPDGRELDPTLKELVGRWMEQVPRVELEIRDRIQRGANLVFATMGACTDQNVATGATGSLYDWVIIEEAARAWPTELAQPLIRGLRWTLVGDHLQLPAYDELSVQKFLELCQQSSHEELQLHAARRQEYLEVFKPFGSLFDNRAKRRKARPPSSRLIEPLDELDLQFRMHPDICRLVSRAFYRLRINPSTGELEEHQDGWLRADETTARPHGLSRPLFLRGRALVWLDTEDVEDTQDQRAWRNDGEAGLIKQLLHLFSPVPASDQTKDSEGFALLTPYHAQIDALSGAGLPSWALRNLHTVDSYQGREADVVVVSMVRSTQRDDQRPESNIGFFVSPNRVNVLLSRARRLLVIVGRLAHFEQQALLNPRRTDVQFWKTIAEEVRRQKAVISGTILEKGSQA